MLFKKDFKFLFVIIKIARMFAFDDKVEKNLTREIVNID